MLVISSAVRQVSLDKFGIAVVDGSVMVPDPLGRILETNAIVHATQVLPFLERQRTHIATRLGWTADQYDSALTSLRAALPKDVVDNPMDYSVRSGVIRP